MRPPMSVLPVFSKTMTTRRCFARWHPAAIGRRLAGRERGGLGREGERTGEETLSFSISALAKMLRRK